jgi:hypothetical protein
VTANGQAVKDEDMAQLPPPQCAFREIVSLDKGDQETWHIPQ